MLSVRCVFAYVCDDVRKVIDSLLFYVLDVSKADFASTQTSRLQNGVSTHWLL